MTDTVPSRQVPQDTTTAGSQFVTPSASRNARRPMPKAQIEDPKGVSIIADPSEIFSKGAKRQ